MDKLLTRLVQPIVEEPKSLLFVAGVAVVVVALSGGVPYIPVAAGSPQQIAMVVFGCILSFMGIFFLFGAGTTRPYGVEITSPEPNATVEQDLIVTGSVRKIPEGKELWLVRIYDDESYTPGQKIFQNHGERKWSSKFHMGLSGIKIGAFMVGEEGQALFDYQKEAANRLSALVKQQSISDNVPNRYLPSLKRETVKALKIKECHVVKVTRRA
jgi:hypothetical protein